MSAYFLNQKKRGGEVEDSGGDVVGVMGTESGFKRGVVKVTRWRDDVFGEEFFHFGC